jgi:signal transduction histidine kinase
MLDMSKFEAGKMSLHRKNERLCKVVSEVIEIMAPLLDRHKITLVWNPDEKLRHEELFIDPEKIGQVVNNLLANAIKFTPEKGTIIFKLVQVEDGFLELSVTDNGPGIPLERQEYLFDKYAQFDPERKVKGTGLGLAVSKLIVESHGGTIGYRPVAQGKGSTFYFRLPSL